MSQKLLTVKGLCEYTGWGQTKVRALLKDPNSTFTIKYGNRLYADREKFDEYLDRCIEYQIRI